MRLAPSPFILRGRAAEAELTTTTSGIAPHRYSLRPGFDSKRESTFYGEGYIGRNHAHPRNHGAVSDETKIPRLPKAIVGSESIRTPPSLPWRPEARATLEIASTIPEYHRAKNERAGRRCPIWAVRVLSRRLANVA